MSSNIKTVEEFSSQVKAKIKEQHIQLKMVSSMQSSAAMTTRQFKKANRSIEKGTPFFKYYEAKLALDNKDSKDLKQFARELAAHVSRTQKIFHTYDGPFNSALRKHKTLLRRAERAKSAVLRLQRELSEKQNLNSIAPEDALRTEIHVLTERLQVLEQENSIARANLQNGQADLQLIINNYTKALQTAYTDCIKFEKQFFKHVSNIDDVTVFFNRIKEIDQIAQRMDIEKQSNQYFNNTLQLQNVLKDVVYDDKTVNEIREEQKQAALLKKQLRQSQESKDENQENAEETPEMNVGMMI